jgi:hypothetical protein
VCGGVDAEAQAFLGANHEHESRYMNHRQIRDALASVFIEVELTVKVKHARSTNSVYLTVSNGSSSLAYVIRIADHKSSVKYSKIDDYWINASKPNVVPDINAAIQGAARRFGVYIGEVVPEQPQRVEDTEVVSEKVVQTSDYSNQLCPPPRQSMINLEQYYLTSQGFVHEIDNNPEVEKWVGHLPKELDGSDPWGGVKFFSLLVIILLAVYYLV